MWVEYVGNDSPVNAAVRSLSEATGEDCASAAEVAAALRLEESVVLDELARLELSDWVTRDDDDWSVPATPQTRWIPRDHCNLTVGKRYEVLGIEADDYRILNDRNDPVLHHPSGFRVMTAAEPAFWKSSLGSEMERYAYPEAWLLRGFFGKYHDGVREAREQFWDDLRTLYPETWKERSTPG